MTEQTLHVSLGHNSSAALALNGRVVRAYEQERIDRKKSSSAYPREAIELAVGSACWADVAYVSHWFDDLSLKSNKYLDLDHLRSIAEEVVGLSDTFTHHDAHAASAASFFRSSGGRCDDADVIVLDGFGTSQECFSVYGARWPLSERPKLAHRTYGYGNSLGLMYQYTTEFLGMRPNRDEYKLLGYESHVLEHTTRAHALMIQSVVADQAEHHARAMMDSTNRPAPSGQLIDYEALKFAKAKWWENADMWRSMFKGVDTEEGVRACVAFCAQTFLEFTVARLIDLAIPGPRQGPAPQLILAGGCHYNVKLNRRIQLETNRRVFSHPLSGDQGAALGFLPGLDCASLELGERVLGQRDQRPHGVEIVAPEAWVGVAAQLLERGRIVNVVRGGMEYGPRALCNTTTFALPTRHSVRVINALNERDEAMPMAPAMTRSAALHLLRHSELLEVSPSDRFMITTCSFAEQPPDRLMGVAHQDPLSALWTARPQVVDGGPVAELLGCMPDQTLINTSFNYHGEPIVFTEDDACKTHEMQSFRAQQLDLEPPVTLIVRDEP